MFQLFMYDFVFIIDFAFVVQVFPMAMHCMRKFLTVKLTFVEVHDKMESKLFSLASCMN
jgi:hypothetical protein